MVMMGGGLISALTDNTALLFEILICHLQCMHPNFRPGAIIFVSAATTRRVTCLLNSDSKTAFPAIQSG